MIFSFFEKLINPFPSEEPTEPPKGLVAFCLHYSRDIWPALLAMSVLAIIIGIIEVNLFAFMGNIVDWLSETNKQTFYQDNAATLWVMAILLLVVLPLAVFLQSALIHQTLLGNYPMKVRWQAHRYLLKQSMNFFNNEFAGRIGAKVMQTSLAVREVVMIVLEVLLYMATYVAGIVYILGEADWRLMLPMIGWIVVYGWMLYYFVPRLQKISQEQSDARSLMTGRIVDSYSNIGTVKLFSHSSQEADYAKDGMNGFLQTVYAQMRKVTQFHTSLYMLNMVTTFIVAALAIHLWLIDEISLGVVATGIAMMLRINGLSQWIMWEVSDLFENIGTVEDGIETISKPREVQNVDNPMSGEIDKGAISFDHVGFNYGKTGGIMEDLSLTIEAGQKIGLVGRSGAGKSTFINLLLRMYDVEKGQISVDGLDISQIEQEKLRKNIGVVTQDTSLFHRSVYDNIAYGIDNASKEEIIAAAKRANAHEFILDLEDNKGRKGYEAYVGERGVKLSGGQRQRIAIARVFLKDAPILVLDEATSALDSEVEFAIQDNLFELMEGKTVIAIAHRLSTISALDRLIVLDQGKIVEDGSHDELARGSGIYSELWKRQSGGFLSDGEDQNDD